MENAENTLSCRGKINEKRSATLLFLIGKFFYYLGFNEKKSATKNQQ